VPCTINLQLEPFDTPSLSVAVRNPAPIRTPAPRTSQTQSSPAPPSLSLSPSPSSSSSSVTLGGAGGGGGGGGGGRGAGVGLRSNSGRYLTAAEIVANANAKVNQRQSPTPTTDAPAPAPVPQVVGSDDSESVYTYVENDSQSETTETPRSIDINSPTAVAARLGIELVGMSHQHHSGQQQSQAQAFFPPPPGYFNAAAGNPSAAAAATAPPAPSTPTAAASSATAAAAALSAPATSAVVTTELRGSGKNAAPVSGTVQVTVYTPHPNYTMCGWMLKKSDARFPMTAFGAKVFRPYWFVLMNGELQYFQQQPHQYEKGGTPLALDQPKKLVYCKNITAVSFLNDTLTVSFKQNGAKGSWVLQVQPEAYENDMHRVKKVFQMWVRKVTRSSVQVDNPELREAASVGLFLVPGVTAKMPSSALGTPRTSFGAGGGSIRGSFGSAGAGGGINPAEIASALSTVRSGIAGETSYSNSNSNSISNSISNSNAIGATTAASGESETATAIVKTFSKERRPSSFRIG
jgi:hypothetical protein